MIVPQITPSSSQILHQNTTRLGETIFFWRFHESSASIFHQQRKKLLGISQRSFPWFDSFPNLPAMVPRTHISELPLRLLKLRCGAVTHTRMHTCTSTHTHTHSHACTHAYTHNTHTHTTHTQHTHTLTRMHAHTHTHTHTQALPGHLNAMVIPVPDPMYCIMIPRTPGYCKASIKTWSSGLFLSFCKRI